MLPTRKQWREWSLPSRLTAIGTLLSALGLFLAVLFYFFPRASKIEVIAQQSKTPEIDAPKSKLLPSMVRTDGVYRLDDPDGATMLLGSIQKQPTRTWFRFFSDGEVTFGIEPILTGRFDEVRRALWLDRRIDGWSHGTVRYRGKWESIANDTLIEIRSESLPWRYSGSINTNKLTLDRIHVQENRHSLESTKVAHFHSVPQLARMEQDEVTLYSEDR